VKLHKTINLSILFIIEVTWKTWKALSMWVLIKNVYKRESKEKRRKGRGTTKKNVTILGDDDDRHPLVVGACQALCMCFFYHPVSALSHTSWRPT